MDLEPITYQMGGHLWWSRHEEAGPLYYKQIIRLLPANRQLLSSANSLAFGLDQNVLTDVVDTLSARFEPLVNALVTAGVISKELQSNLVGELTGNFAISDDQRDEITWRSRRVRTLRGYSTRNYCQKSELKLLNLFRPCREHT